MEIFCVILSVLSVFFSCIFCNAFLMQYNLYIVLAGAIIRIVSELLDIVPATILLIFNGLLLDAMNFSPHFGGSVVIYLLFYGIYRYVSENNKNFIENFSSIMVQTLNLVFILYFGIVQMQVIPLLQTIILSQIVVYFLDRGLVRLNAWIFKKRDKNPFNIARNFSKNTAP